MYVYYILCISCFSHVNNIETRAVPPYVYAGLLFYIKKINITVEIVILYNSKSIMFTMEISA